MDAIGEHAALLAQLQALADPVYRAGNEAVMPSALPSYGVRVPQLRGLARAWQRAQGAVPAADLLPLVELLWAAPSLDERAMALLLLGRYPRHVQGLSWEHFERWRHGLDNWGLTDGLATGPLGTWLLADPEARSPYLWRLIDDPVLWSRRLALVAPIPMLRTLADPRVADLALGLVDRVAHERHPMIAKAISWTLRELYKLHRPRLVAYLELNRGRLPAIARRETETKLRTGVKSGRPRGHRQEQTDV
jgi:3-methyladenine DNA glycosylase AlkD